MATVVVVVVVDFLGFFFSFAARRFEKKSWYQSDSDSVVVVSGVATVERGGSVLSALTMIRLLRSIDCGSPGDFSKLSSSCLSGSVQDQEESPGTTAFLVEVVMEVVGVVGVVVEVNPNGLPMLNPSILMVDLVVVSARGLEIKLFGSRITENLSPLTPPGFLVEESFSSSLLLFDTNGLWGFS